MISSISGDAKGEEWRQSSARVLGVDKYKENGVFKVKKGENSKVEG